MSRSRTIEEIINDIMQKLPYDTEELQQRLTEFVPRLNLGQKKFSIVFWNRLKMVKMDIFSECSRRYLGVFPSQSTQISLAQIRKDKSIADAVVRAVDVIAL
ncbi:hypothetical protein AVEN_116795-1 [Araneus ventricosus]|uniref:Uncharacterized protein n=1 Tax=Araneus ventricosus TaxID=182803 RepID=A0A4Y2S7J1_ARAVE|nr:hypothetical protein AVEN_116795-1 [Araneus ventricosus]